MTTIRQTCSLPDGTEVEVASSWKWFPQGDGSFTNARGWELMEFNIYGHPRLSLDDRQYISKQVEPPSQ